MSGPVDDKAARLAAARAQLAEIQAAQDAKEADHELATLELEVRLSRELGGPRGVEFAIVESVDGPIAFKVGPAVLWTKLQKAIESPRGASSADFQEFLAPLLVFPDAAAFNAMVVKRSGLLGECVVEVAPLYKGRKEARRGK